MAFELRWGIISTGRIASDFVKVCFICPIIAKRLLLRLDPTDFLRAS